jgi:addiction module RelE/StbE family toxin
MIIKWRELASADLDRIVEFLEAHNVKAAYSVLEAIVAASRTLETFPNRGRPGRVAGTRELLAAKNYILVYEVDEDAGTVLIRRIFHTRQDR